MSEAQIAVRILLTITVVVVIVAALVNAIFPR